MKVPAGAKVLLRILAVLLLAAGAGYGYDRLLDLELAGYRGIRANDLEHIGQRDARRRLIAGFPATRERLLQAEFGDLPEAASIRTELQLIHIAQKWLALMFGLIGIGAFSYLIFGRRKAPWRRGLLVAAALLGGTQALPLLILPDDAVRLVRQYGVPLLALCTLVLLAEAIWYRLANRQKAKPPAAGDSLPEPPTA